MATATRRQELPPPGGYQPLNFARKPAKQFVRPGFLVAAYFVSSIGAVYLGKLGIDRYTNQKTEERSAMMALMPMLLAERDRAYLKQLRRNRDEETELMKNVDGWVVGTWYGEPCYRLAKPDTLLPPNHHEYFVHADEDTWFKWRDFKNWS